MRAVDPPFDIQTIRRGRGGGEDVDADGAGAPRFQLSPREPTISGLSMNMMRLPTMPLLYFCA